MVQTINGSASGTNSGSNTQSNNGCLVAIGLIAVVFFVAKCAGDSPTSSATQEVSVAQDALATAVATQVPPAITDLSPAVVRRGGERVAKAAVEGLAGEMIYSQNCYEVVGQAFTWPKLDECAAFDWEASLDLGDEVPPGSEREAAWFDQEAAAGRFLKAAIAAGMEEDAADQRLSDLQSRVNSRHSVAATPTSSALPRSDETEVEDWSADDVSSPTLEGEE
jgi:hypothetical protein